MASRTSFFAALVIAFAALGSCASPEKGDGSESHFVHCKSDAECVQAGLGKCIAGTCDGASASDGSAPDGSKPDAARESCASAATFKCVPECGLDGLYEPVCTNDVWTCPPNASHRTDQCPPTCAAPLPPCCSPTGVVDRLCADGSDPVCPIGSYEVKGNCPTDCATPNTKMPLPYRMTFRFTNATGKDVAVWHGCNYEHTLTACASGYSTPVEDAIFCSPICPDTSQVVCGACFNEPAAVSATTPLTLDWDGYLYTTKTITGRTCSEQTALPDTRYRITVPVYPTTPMTLPGGGYDKTPLYTVSVDFVSSPGGVVDVPVDQKP